MDLGIPVGILELPEIRSLLNDGEAIDCRRTALRRQPEYVCKRSVV
jgi:hypothetical protein